MNKKRQREIAYLKLNQNGTGFFIVIQAAHAESLAEHFRNKSVPFVKQGTGTEASLEFSEGRDGVYLARVLKEWKESFVSGGEHFW